MAFGMYKEVGPKIEVKFFTCVSFTYIILIRGEGKRCYNDLSNARLCLQNLVLFLF